MDSIKMLTVAEVAELLRVHKNQVLRFCKAGLPYHQYGNKYTFLESDVATFIKDFRKVSS